MFTNGGGGPGGVHVRGRGLLVFVRSLRLLLLLYCYDNFKCYYHDKYYSDGTFSLQVINAWGLGFRVFGLNPKP